jgi:hypothetical protein
LHLRQLDGYLQRHAADLQQHVGLLEPVLRELRLLLADQLDELQRHAHLLRAAAGERLLEHARLLPVELTRVSRLQLVVTLR